MLYKDFGYNNKQDCYLLYFTSVVLKVKDKKFRDKLGYIETLIASSINFKTNQTVLSERNRTHSGNLCNNLT